MSVDAIGFSAELLKAVKACGYKKLTPIQQQAIPVIRAGHDLLATAQTGTGKTHTIFGTKMEIQGVTFFSFTNFISGPYFQSSLSLLMGTAPGLYFPLEEEKF